MSALVPNGVYSKQHTSVVLEHLHSLSLEVRTAGAHTGAVRAHQRDVLRSRAHGLAVAPTEILSPEP